MYDKQSKSRSKFLHRCGCDVQQLDVNSVVHTSCRDVGVNGSIDLHVPNPFSQWVGVSLLCTCRTHVQKLMFP